MPGNTASTWLDSLNWGTSTGGAAGSAETTNTLGTDRIDVRVPPDQFHVGGLQISNMKNLLISMSQYFQGGTRLKVLQQSANPFGATEVGWYADNATTPNPRFSALGTLTYVANGAVTTKGDLCVFNGTNFGVLAGNPTNGYVLTADNTQTLGVKWAAAAGGGTLKTTYTNGASSADSIIGLTSTLGPVLIRDNATPIAGTLFGVQNSGGTTKYVDITDNGAMSFKTAQAATTSGGFTFDTVNDQKGAETFVLSNQGNEYFALMPQGFNQTQMRFYNATGGTALANVTVHANDWTFGGASGGVVDLLGSRVLSSTYSSIANAQTAGVTLTNSTSATSGAANQQYSPALQLTGQQYNGSASVAVDWQLQTRPVSGQTTTGDLVFWNRYNAGSWSEALSIKNNATVGIAIQGSGNQIDFVNTNVDGIGIFNASVQFLIGNSSKVTLQSGYLAPSSSVTLDSGTSTSLWDTNWAKRYATGVGTAIASAATISPTYGVHHITGTTQINTINVPVSSFTGSIVLIPDGAFTTGTSGNIAIASTAVVSKALIMTYDGTKWYPSY